MAPSPAAVASSTTRRRRRPTSSWISIAATLAVTGYATYRLACWAWNNSKKEDDEEENVAIQGRFYGKNDAIGYYSRNSTIRSSQSSDIQKMRHVALTATAEEELINALRACGPLLKDAVNASTDYSSEVKSLKNLRRQAQRKGADEDNNSNDLQQQELWEKIKEKSITRLLLTAYSQPLIILILYIQILILRRHSMQKEENNMIDCNTRKELFTRTLEYFFLKSLPKLSSAIECSVHSRLCCWTVTTTMDMRKSEFEAGVHTVQWNFNAENEDNISTFLVDVNQEPIQRNSFDNDRITELNAPNDISNEAVAILEETWDILESPLFKDAWKEVISDFNSFGMTIRLAVDNIFQRNENITAAPEVTTTLPLATIITKLKKSSDLLYFFENEKGETASVSHLLNFPSVTHLARSCLSF
jgi:hypothetical protein